jgi:hypothetical protein
LRDSRFSKVSLGIRSNDQLRYLSRGDYWFHSGKRYLALFARQTPAGALTLHARDEVSKEEAVLQLSDSTDLSRDTLSLSENSFDLPQTPAVQQLLEEKLARMGSGGKRGGTGGGDAAGSKSSSKRGKGGRRSGTSVSEDGSVPLRPEPLVLGGRRSARANRSIDSSPALAPAKLWALGACCDPNANAQTLSQNLALALRCAVCRLGSLSALLMISIPMSMQGSGTRPKRAKTTNSRTLRMV